MTLPIRNHTRTTAPDVDELLQDTYLLVVELQQGAALLETDQLRQRCVTQIQHARDQLAAGGMSQASIDAISHAQCALLDETILSRAKGDVHGAWARAPLQAQFFNRHQAGEFLYEELRELLARPVADPQVLTAYQRVLMLGFRGRYVDAQAPERERLVAALNERVAPLAVHHAMPTQARCSAGRWRRRAVSPLACWLAPALLLGAIWWGLDRYLEHLVATLLAGQA